jgi:hypothetical protein
MATLPSFATLSKAYPDYINYPDPQQVKDLIGGNVNAAWIDNTCAIRMSRALNYSGIPMPSHYEGLETVSGGDHLHYAFRVRELRPWLTATLDKPAFDIKKAADEVFDKSVIAHLKGIIGFDIHFSDASGHFDLWNGEVITSEHHMSRNYYDAATRITVWTASV